jgi:putative transcriptional regulator
MRLACALLLAAAVPLAVAQPPEHGFFLVAKPSILDPNFQGTVVLVTNAPDGATLGVIINRPTERSLANILPGNPTLAKFTEPLYFGGPVERVGLFAVFRAKEAPGQSFPVAEDLHLALHPATVEQLLRKPPEKVRFFNGYSGWAPGQLAVELERGDWWVFEADPETAFRKDTATLWEELARRARSITALRSDSFPRNTTALARHRGDASGGPLRSSAFPAAAR